MGVLGGVLVTWSLITARVLRQPHGLRIVTAEVLLGVSVSFPVVSLLSQIGWRGGASAWPLIALAITAAILAELLAHLGRSWTLGRTCLVGLLTAATWVPVAVVELMKELVSIHWMPLAAAGLFAATVLALYSFTRVTVSRAGAVPWLRSNDHAVWLVAGLVGLVAVFVVLRLTVMPKFGEADALVWSMPKNFPGWIGGLVIGAVTAGAAVRSGHRPLFRVGASGFVVALVIASSSFTALWVVDGLLRMAAPQSAVSNWAATALYDMRLITPLQLFGAVTVSIGALLLPALRRSLARVLAVIALLSIVPPLGVQMWVNYFGQDAFDTMPEFGAAVIFFAVPDSGQVTVGIVAATSVLAVWGLIRPHRAASPSVLLRLAFSAVLAASTAIILALPREITLVLIAVGVLLSLFWTMPPVAASPYRHAANVLRVAASQLGSILLIALCAAGGVQQDLQSLAFQWLLPVVVVLVACDTRGNASGLVRDARARGTEWPNTSSTPLANTAPSTPTKAHEPGVA